MSFKCLTQRLSLSETDAGSLAVQKDLGVVIHYCAPGGKSSA